MELEPPAFGGRGAARGARLDEAREVGAHRKWAAWDDCNEVEQALREPRKLRVELQLHARGEKREALEQPFDVRVGNFDAFHAQPAGDLRELAREFRTHLADVLELAVVVSEESRVHGLSLGAVR